MIRPSKCSTTRELEKKRRSIDQVSVDEEEEVTWIDGHI
jgi:hypothetical protein